VLLILILLAFDASAVEAEVRISSKTVRGVEVVIVVVVVVTGVVVKKEELFKSVGRANVIKDRKSVEVSKRQTRQTQKTQK
jgi:hypothetical protein